MSDVINSLLHYSYDPGCQRAGLQEAIRETATEQPHTEDADTLQRMAVDAMEDAIDAGLRTVPDGATHVVPLSSGLDSRAILATLLDRPQVDRADVRTVTFGTPGTWDYEIARRVASVAGLEHESIDLTADSFDWSVAALREYAADRSCPGGIFDGYVNAMVSTHAPPESVVWAGFTGGVTTGVSQPADPCTRWEDACASFARRERYAQGLTAPGFDPSAVLPDEPFVSRRRLSFEEQLDFGVRQQCAITPMVIDDETYRFPFLHPAWLQFSLNLPAEHRTGRSLFVDAFSNAFPDLFSQPTGANAGYPLSVGEHRRLARRARLRVIDAISSLIGTEFTHPATNYVDFEAAFREGELKDAADELLGGFAARDVAPWLDPAQIWREHQDGEDRTRAIQVICYAELSVGQSPRKAGAAVA